MKILVYSFRAFDEKEYFDTLCKKEGFKIENINFQSEHLASKVLSALGLKNFGTEHVIATISKI